MCMLLWRHIIVKINLHNKQADDVSVLLGAYEDLACSYIVVL